MKIVRTRYSSIVAGAVGAALALAWTAFPNSPEADPATMSGMVMSAAPAATVGGLPALADIIEQVKPAVVTINVEQAASNASRQLRQRRAPPGQALPGSPLDDFLERFFGPEGQGGRSPRSMALGSGFIVDPDGYIVTNNHVVSGATTVKVTLADGRELSAEVVGVDELTDLAVIKVGERNLPFVSFGDSDKTRVGDWVIAIGNPFGFGGSATVGIVSARGRDLASGPYDDFLQIDAAINSGNSGGPVFNIAGQVVGVNTAIFSPNGGNVGLGFAIPAAQAQKVIAQLRTGGAVQRGWLGVEIQALSDPLAASLGLNDKNGALVASVSAGSPAEKAGVQAGDVIRQFANKDVQSPRDLSRLVAEANAGKQAELVVLRDGRERTLRVDVGEMTDASASAPVANANGGADLGLALAPLSSGVRQRYNIDPSVEGVLVTDVRPGSAAALQGLQPGDVIAMVNQQAVESVGDVQSALRKAKADKRNAVSMLVQRGDQKRFLAIDTKE